MQLLMHMGGQQQGPSSLRRWPIIITAQAPSGDWSDGGVDGLRTSEMHCASHLDREVMGVEELGTAPGLGLNILTGVDGSRESQIPG